MSFKFPVINPLLHNELRLKIMVALDSLESANFMYLCEITSSTRGNLSVQIKTLQEAGYLQVDKSGSGPAARSVCRITAAIRSGIRRRISSCALISGCVHFTTCLITCLSFCLLC